MKRIFVIFLVLSLLPIPAKAVEEEKYAALTFEDGPNGRYTRALLDGLYDRGVRGTFALCGCRMEEYPELTQRICAEGHEICHHGFTHQSLAGMSRRAIAGELMAFQALLPEGCRPVFLRPPEGSCNDAVRQVAEARRLSLLGWSAEAGDPVKDGDIILLRDRTDADVQAALKLVDRLLREGFRLVTVSELAKHRNIRLTPGQIYNALPSGEGAPEEGG